MSIQVWTGSIFPGFYTCNDLPMALSDEDESKIPDVSIVESSAEMLYGLVHQRFILTRAGLQAMASLGQTEVQLIGLLKVTAR